MKKSKWKTVLAGVAVLIAIAAIVCFVWPRNEENGENDIRKDTRILTESFPTKTLVLGDEFPVLPKGARVEYIKSLSQEVIDISGTEYKYVMLIINDIDRNVHLTDEDFDTIREILKLDYVFFSYIGGSQLAEFDRRGFHQNMGSITEDGNLSFTYFGGVELTGVYSKEIEENVKDRGLSDGSLFEGIQSAMVYMLEDQMQETGGGIR
ncbi:MAG: hypothetical protein K6B39_07420 [Lachnospiraceae bacterium]|nr:hypothetical protein [Lachnospiraceae bacterium]